MQRSSVVSNFGQLQGTWELTHPQNHLFSFENGVYLEDHPRKDMVSLPDLLHPLLAIAFCWDDPSVLSSWVEFVRLSRRKSSSLTVSPGKNWRSAVNHLFPLRPEWRPQATATNTSRLSASAMAVDTGAPVDMSCFTGMKRKAPSVCDGRVKPGQNLQNQHAWNLNFQQIFFQLFIPFKREHLSWSALHWRLKQFEASN